MSKFIDLTGQTFGRLTVVSRAENSKNKAARWNCNCSCGNVIKTTGNALKRKKKPTKSCGCYNKDRIRSTRKCLLGETRNWLTIKSLNKRENGATYWDALCKCGNQTLVRQNDFISGRRISCGCAQAINVSKEKVKQAQVLVGKRFKRLVVLSVNTKDLRRFSANVICDCGNKKTVLLQSLRSGYTKSCGCLGIEKAYKRGVSDKGLYNFARADLSRGIGVENVPESLIKVQAMRFKISNFLKQS